MGLAQGGLATDPGGDGMKSGTSQNTSPGFGAFLAFPPPMAACLCLRVCVQNTESKERNMRDRSGGACSQCTHYVCKFYIRCVGVSQQDQQHGSQAESIVGGAVIKPELRVEAPRLSL